jgi:hypothetical protein
MDERRAELDLAESFARAGRTWVELDDEGRVVERDGRAGSRATKKPAADGPTAKEPPAAKRSANNRQRAPKKPASALVAEAIGLADGSTVYDNSSASRPFRVVARFEHGAVMPAASWPRWTPKALQADA